MSLVRAFAPDVEVLGLRPGPVLFDDGVSREAQLIVSHEARFVFVHVQKTAGISIESALTRTFPDADTRSVSGTRHATYSEILAAAPELVDYFSFGFVRNPWARMYSWHAMVLRRKERADAGDARWARRIRKNPFWSGVVRDLDDFEDFVLRGPDMFTRLRTPQIDYLTADARRVDHIGRTEEFELSLRTIFEFLNRPVPKFEKRNVGPITDYRQHYNQIMRDRVAEIFAPDISEFGYEF